MAEKKNGGLDEVLTRQKEYYASGNTRDTAARVDVLKKLKASIIAREKELLDALHADLGKSGYEAYLTEVSVVMHELNVQIKHLRRWSKPEKVGSPLFLWPSRSQVLKEPYGHTLIISPWNYPFQLSMAPLAAAVAAGNVVALKPSHKTPQTAAVIERIVSQTFDPEWVSCFLGPTDLSTQLLASGFDYIFFTGSPRVGRIVMEAAAKNLTPVTLELGGKSPCIVDRDADLKTAARRIMWGKLINAGQTCIAPDYLFVQRDVKDELLGYMKGFIKEFYRDDPAASPDYPRIVSEDAAQRLAGLIKGMDIYTGGASDPQKRYVEPTILDNVSPDDAIMQEEIFGPVLPVMTFGDMAEVVDFINARPKPLALYYFGNKKDGLKVLARTSSGGACINDTLLHVANPKLPFGGVGNSGMGSYHGRYGFETFTHRRGTLISKTWVDFKLKFPPFEKLSTVKKLM